MNPFVVALVYGIVLAAAVALLHFFQAHWVWHALSLAAALALGLIPIPYEWKPPDLAIGCLFLFLFVWGLGVPAFRTHGAHHRRPHHA